MIIMAAINKLTATGIPNVRQRLLANGDTAYYIRENDTFVLAGTKSDGMTPTKALRLRDGDRGAVQDVNTPTVQQVGITLDDVFARFERLVLDMDKPTKNMTDYLPRYHLHIKDRFGSRPLASITATEIGAFHAELKRKKSESLAYLVCHTIRYLYNRAAEWNLYDGRVPMGKGTAFKLPMPQRKREETYTSDDMEQILGELKGRSQQTHDMVLLAYMSGLRLKEIRGLQVCHVNIRTGRVKIVDPKGKRDTYIQLSASTLEFMQGYMTDKAPTDYLFQDRNGGQINDLSKTFMRVLKKLGINEGIEDSRFKKSFHNFRHTFATEVLASGKVSIGDLKNILGHKSVKTTERYVHPSEVALGVAADVMDRKLNG
jgi:integrase